MLVIREAITELSCSTSSSSLIMAFVISGRQHSEKCGVAVGLPLSGTGDGLTGGAGLTVGGGLTEACPAWAILWKVWSLSRRRWSLSRTVTRAGAHCGLE